MNTNKPGFAKDRDATAPWIIGFCVARGIIAVALVSVIVACAPAEATRSADVAAQQTGASAGFEYFPAQYVNQAGQVEDPIQAF